MAVVSRILTCMIVLAGDLLQEENVAVKIAVPVTVGIVLILVVTGVSIGLYSHYRRKPQYSYF